MAVPAKNAKIAKNRGKPLPAKFESHLRRFLEFRPRFKVQPLRPSSLAPSPQSLFPSPRVPFFVPPLRGSDVISRPARGWRETLTPG